MFKLINGVASGLAPSIDKKEKGYLWLAALRIAWPLLS
jgi:hypothetical protein